MRRGSGRTAARRDGVGAGRDGSGGGIDAVRLSGVGVSGGWGTTAGCTRVVDGGPGGANEGGAGARATMGGGTRTAGGGADGRDGCGCGSCGGTVRATTRNAEDDDVSATAECSAVFSDRERHRTA
jgi:hypothetical protein